MKYCIKVQKWELTIEVQEVGSGAKTREKREELLKLARRGEIDAILVWKLDRFGRSLVDLVTTLSELRDLKVLHIVNESLDFDTPSGRAMAGLPSTFAEVERDVIRERVQAGIINAREEGRPHGRPRTASLKRDKIHRLKEHLRTQRRTRLVLRARIIQRGCSPIPKRATRVSDMPTFLCWDFSILLPSPTRISQTSHVRRLFLPC